jgi:hypothetical protein
MLELLLFLIILSLGVIAFFGLLYGIAKGLVKLIWNILK